MIFRHLLLACFLTLVWSGAVQADQAVPADLTPEDQQQLTNIETYLNGIVTIKARFLQTSQNGYEANGTFYLYRPGRLRFDYETPNKDIIVADKRFIWYYDSKLKEANHAPISRTLADFLLRKDIKLHDGDVTVTDFKRADNVDQIVVTQSNDPGAGSMTLVLTESPMQLRQWRVVDAESRATDVTLQDAKFRMPLDPALFVWKEPEGE